MEDGMKIGRSKSGGVVVSALALVLLTGTLAGCSATQPSIANGGAIVVPAPQTDTGEPNTALTPAPEPTESGTSGTSQTVVLAGGCFWGVQGVYQHVKGVTRAESGYAGGSDETADYETVSTGTSGHAESVRVTFDPAQVSYGQILQIFFSVVHDPTELDRQGPDTGTQYRSEIFAQDADEQRVANAYIAQLTDQELFPDPIVTKVEMNTAFYPAEAYHQDYLDENPTARYIEINDMPKVHDLESMYPKLWSDQPVLIHHAH